MLDAPRQIAKRRLLTAVSLSAAGLILPFDPVVAARHEEKQPEVTPPEDLMREHGVLDRLLLVYEACLRKFDANEDFEKKEHQKLGGDGFEMMVHRVAGIEQGIGIADLAQFTPK